MASFYCQLAPANPIAPLREIVTRGNTAEIRLFENRCRDRVLKTEIARDLGYVYERIMPILLGIKRSALLFYDANAARRHSEL
jgi:hypothetical protein